MRFELTQANAHYPLKVACLPISPPGLFQSFSTDGLLQLHPPSKERTSNYPFGSANIATILRFTKNQRKKMDISAKSSPTKGPMSGSGQKVRASLIIILAI